MNTYKEPRSKWLIFISFIMIISGFYLLIGGGWLSYLGGSSYYIISGVVILISANLLLKRNPLSIWIFNLLLLATLIWSLWEVGTDFWALAPRLDIFFIIGILLLIPSVTKGINNTFFSKVLLFILLVSTLIIIVYGAFNDPQEIKGEIARSQPAISKTIPGIDNADWPAYGRTQAGVRYSPLTQINSDNVKNLEAQWTYNTQDFKGPNDSAETTNEVTPIKIKDNLFLCTPHQWLISLEPDTGKEKWKFDPKLQSNNTFQHMTCRGVSYYDQENISGFSESLKNRKTTSLECPRKVILPVNDGRLIAINADNGQKCSDFGDKGEINLLKSMPYAYLGGYNPTSPPIVTGTTIITGGSVTDNFSNKEPSGVIRGYDVNSGELMWVFDTGASDPNAMLSEGNKFVNNSPNAWAPLAYDAERDIVYIPTGVGTPDIWGGDRDKLKERYANSVLALNASTGELIWNFQTTHHDLWDMDVPSQPSLVDIKNANNEITPVIYIVTKTGNVFVLDRRDGTIVVPIEERNVPVTVKKGPQTKGENYSPTQPFSALNMAPQQKLTDKDMWGATLFDQLLCRISFENLNYDGIYTPPSENGTLVFPGNLGVFEWGGISVNEDRQVALMNPIGLPFVSQLIPEDINRPEVMEGGKAEAGIQPMFGTPYGVKLSPFLSPLGLPCKQPAWGYVAAVDLTTNKVVWKKRIGTIRDSLPNLFQLPPVEIGVPGLGGSISTAGDLMFVAATQDNYIRAYRVSNGDKVWEQRLPAGGQATPMTYEYKGKQYVVIMAGGHSSFGTKEGDSLVAYALPDIK